MTRQMSRAERLEAALQEAQTMYEDLEAWYDKHPDATYDEIEQQVRRGRRKLMGRMTEILINGRDTGIRPIAPKCGVCGKEMSFHSYRKWTVRGLEGDACLERAYYRCSECGEQGFFPPRPETSATP